MLILLSSVCPLNYKSSEIELLQSQYVEAFKSWKSVYKGGYYYVDNSIDRVSDIRNAELLDIFWDVYDFGAVIPHVILTRDYTSDKIIGTYEMFKLSLSLLLDKKIPSNNKYTVFSLGRRKLIDSNEFLNIEIEIQNLDYFFLSDSSLENIISDNLFICKTSSLIDVYNFIIDYKDIKDYQYFLTVLFNRFVTKSKVIETINFTDNF